MKLSAFTMCRNAVKLYYPIEESIRSVLPLVDEFVIVVGKGDPDDETLEKIRSINSDKIKVIETEWDTTLFPNGTVHAQQTDLAKAHCTGDWLLYLQADEVMHEHDLPKLKTLIEHYHHRRDVEGFLFQYHHFWGDYQRVVRGHGWYPKEIRMIRNLPEIHSWESAQSFRVMEHFDGRNYRQKKGSRKLNVIETEVRVFHYGWVRPPALMTKKIVGLDRIHSHETVRFVGDFNYGSKHLTKAYSGKHPAVMAKRMEAMDWNWNSELAESKRLKHKHERWKYRILTWVEDHFLGGRQLFAFKNYRKVT